VSKMDLASGYLFKGLGKEQLKRISEHTGEIEVKPGHEICREGESAASIFLLCRGAVELITSVNDHIELPVSIMREPGAMFGSSALIEPHVYTLTAKCQSSGSILHIDRLGLQNIMSGDDHCGSVIMKNLAAYFLARLKETRQELKIHFKTLLRSFRA